MGREVRRVPAGWEHPRNERGDYIPLFDGFNTRLAKWEEGLRKWREGYVIDFVKTGCWQPKPPDVKAKTYEDWDGPRPVKEEFMPDWPAAERTHYQMYEDTTEGTPISPVMGTPEELARWLADMGASYEEWLGMIRAGSAPSMVITPEAGMVSGVEAVAKASRKPK